MNHWGRKLFALKPDDGLGGDTGSATQVPAGDTDPILEEPGYLAGGEEFARDPALDGGGEGADPFASFSEDVRREAEKKGWKDPNDMFKAYDGAQSLIGRRDEERDRLQQERDALMAELQQRQQAPASADGPAAPGADPGWTVDFAALETAAGGDPSEMMRLYHENVVPQLLQDYGSHILKAVDQNVGQRIAPVEQYTTQATLKDQATQLARDFPQDFPKHREEIVRLVQARPEYQRSPTGLSQAFYEILATERAREIASSRGQEGETLMGGMNPRGGARQPVKDVAAETRRAIEGAIGSIADGLS